MNMRISGLPKHTKSTLIAHSFTYLGLTAFVHLIALLTIPLLAIMLSPAEVGMAGIYLALTKGAYWCMEFSKVAQISYVQGRSRLETSPATEGSALFTIYLMIALFLCAGLILFWDVVSSAIPIGRGFAAMAVLNGFFLAWLSVSYGLWQISQAAYTYSLFRSGLSLLNLLLLGMGLFYYVLGWQSVVWASLASAGVMFLFSLQAKAWGHSVRLTSDKNAIGAHLRSISAFIPLRVAVALFDSAGPLLVAHYAGLEASGMYLLAYQITGIIPLIHNSIIAALMPALIAKRNAAPSRRTVKAAACAYIAALLVLAALTAGLALFLIQGIMPPQYHAVILFVPWLIAAHVFCAMGSLLVELLLYKTSCLRQVSFYSFPAACVYVIATIALLTGYGGIGGAIGLALGHGVWLMCVLVLAARKLLPARPAG